MLDRIKLLAARGDVVVRKHARDRMDERGATGRDVLNAIATAVAATYQADRDNWKVTGGVDTDGDDLSLIVAVEADLVIVTIF